MNFLEQAMFFKALFKIVDSCRFMSLPIIMDQYDRDGFKRFATVDIKYHFKSVT